MLSAARPALYQQIEGCLCQLSEQCRQQKPLTAFRACIDAGDQLFEQAFDAGEDIVTLVEGRAFFVDLLLTQAWRHVGLDQQNMALIAVGGYGRNELHPYSDVDVLVLLDDAELSVEQKSKLEAFMMLLWDLKFEVGHSVRTLDDCRQQALEDLSTATNLMETHLILGSSRLYQQLQDLVRGDSLWPSADFFQAKLAEQQARHLKYHNTSYNLEPNLKAGPGGLRDLQTIMWVTRRQFRDAQTLHDLVRHGFLAETEHDNLIDKRNFLWKLRFGLHLLCKRKEDRLLFDHQSLLAERLGYRNQNGSLAVEQMMKTYYRAVLKIRSLNDILLQFFSEAILPPTEDEQPQDEVYIIDNWFQVRRNHIEVRHNQVFLQRPAAMLEIFLHIANYPEIRGIRASTIRLFRPHRHLIDSAFRQHPLHKRIFLALLSHPRGAGLPLQLMKRHGILRYYLPLFGNIIGQMQFDLFHAYTVDEHTFILLDNLYRFSLPEHDDEFPLCSHIMQRLKKRHLLYLAGLFHDIAKGRGGDHSELGSEDARLFCLQHGLNQEDTELVAWLVQNHLIMSMTAQRLDISDPEVINRFARQVNDPLHLDYLYCLTVADIRATNDKLWNSWKDALLRELYSSTKSALRRGLNNPLGKDEQILMQQEDARALLQSRRIPGHALQGLWDQLNEDYFLRYSADQIAWHSDAIIHHWGKEGPLVALRPESSEGGTRILIYAHWQLHQFAVVTACLDQQALTIADATVMTTQDGYSLDTFTVLDAEGTAIMDPSRLESLRQMLLAALSQPDKASLKVTRRTSRQVKSFLVPTQVCFTKLDNRQRNQLEVIALDRPGLLARIGLALKDCHIRLHSAKIATLGERVEDIFIVTDLQEQPLDDISQQQLRDEIIKRIEQP